MNKSPFILIVDDNRMNRLVLSKQLSFLEIPISECEDGQQAIDAIKESTFQHIIVLLDLNMPVMDGYKFLLYLRDNKVEFIGKQIEVIVVSASEYAVFKDRKLDVEIVAYLQKVVSKVMLIDAIELAIGKFDFDGI